MDEYIAVNMEIQGIFQNYGSPNDIYPYSIDEGFIDLSSSLNYFVPEKQLSRKQKLDLISAKIQRDIWRQTGIYSTVGMSNANPLLAKLALDNEAKKTPTMRANWSYEDVEQKVWSIPNMTDFWGIGKRMEKRFNTLGIHSIKDLANAKDVYKRQDQVLTTIKSIVFHHRNIRFYLINDDFSQEWFRGLNRHLAAFGLSLIHI